MPSESLLPSENLTTKEGVVSLMKSSKNESEWNANCDKIKKINNGGYPEFWYETVLASGLMNQVSVSWSK